jgi:guanylate kinase
MNKMNVIPHLDYKKEFEEALADYHISDESKQVLASTPFVAVMGLAGGGRNTVIRLLTERHNYIFAISDTTRPPKFRDGRMEQDGIDYYFRKEIDMLHDIQEGKFIEAEIIHNQQVSGTSIREVERTKSTGKVPIHDFEYGGAGAVFDAKPDASIIGLLPPNYEEWIRRFLNRETVHDDEFMNRLRTAKVVLEQMLARPYVRIVINDDIDQCVEDIRKIVEFNEYAPETKERMQLVAKDILKNVNNTLESRS